MTVLTRVGPDRESAAVRLRAGGVPASTRDPLAPAHPRTTHRTAREDLR